MSFELLEYLVTRSRVVGVPMEIFEGDDSNKKDGSFLCDGELRLKCGVASDKRICIPEICVCIDNRDDKGDAAGGECVEKDDIFIFGSLILFLFIVETSYLLSWSH